MTLLVSFFKHFIKLELWRIYDEENGKLLLPFVDQYKPQNGSTTILKFITCYESNASGTLVGMGLVVLCISAIVEGLLFL